MPKPETIDTVRSSLYAALDNIDAALTAIELAHERNEEDAPLFDNAEQSARLARSMTVKAIERCPVAPTAG